MYQNKRSEFDYFLSALKQATRKHGGEKPLTLQHLTSIARNANHRFMKEERDKVLSPKAEISSEILDVKILDGGYIQISEFREETPNP